MNHLKQLAIADPSELRFKVLEHAPVGKTLSQ